jgi:uncharacterized protein involved in tolerance to divalent cations
MIRAKKEVNGKKKGDNQETPVIALPCIQSSYSWKSKFVKEHEICSAILSFRHSKTSRDLKHILSTDFWAILAVLSHQKLAFR